MFSLEAVIEEFEEMAKDAGKVQRETLKKILEENCEAEYLKNLGLGNRTDLESFKACVPLVTHKDLEPYIQRIVDGYSSPILTGKPITSISLSSGTTQGKPKFLPFNEELLQSTLQIFRTSFAFRNRCIYLFLWSKKQISDEAMKNKFNHDVEIVMEGVMKCIINYEPINKIAKWS